jgi:hypothetical protein
VGEERVYRRSKKNLIIGLLIVLVIPTLVFSKPEKYASDLWDCVAPVAAFGYGLYLALQAGLSVLVVSGTGVRGTDLIGRTSFEAKWKDYLCLQLRGNTGDKRTGAWAYVLQSTGAQFEITNDFDTETIVNEVMQRASNIVVAPEAAMHAGARKA